MLIQQLTESITNAMEALDISIADLTEYVRDLKDSPRATASIWSRPASGKFADDPDRITIYLVHSQESEHLRNGGKRLDKIGKVPEARLEAQTRINTQHEYINKKDALYRLESQRKRATNKLRNTIHILDLDQPDGKRYSNYW